MTERQYPVRLVGVDWICDACGAGVCLPTGLILPVSPPRYQHRCSNCGAVAALSRTYPSTNLERLPAD